MLLSGANMLNKMGLDRFSDVIYQAIVNVYDEGEVMTIDLGGKASTTEFTNRVIQEIEAIKNA